MTLDIPLDDNLVSYLVGEVRDLLDAGVVGLYEFLGILRERAPQLPDQILRAHAVSALTHLLNADDAKLVWDVWASAEPPQDAAGAWPTDEDWNDPVTDRYLAVYPKEGRSIIE